MKHAHEFAQFTALLIERLEAGERTYGDTSFARPLARTFDEIEQEALDIVGWGFVLWCQLQALRESVAQLQGHESRPRR